MSNDEKQLYEVKIKLDVIIEQMKDNNRLLEIISETLILIAKQNK